MGFVSRDFHQNFIYFLIFILYFAVCLNFYITYQLNNHCTEKVICDQTQPNSRIKLSQNVKNEPTSESDAKTAISQLNLNLNQRTRRQVVQRRNVDLDYVSPNNGSFDEFRRDYRPPDLSIDHNYHHHNIRHRKRMKSRAAPNEPFDDNSGPAVEFFPKPQPTQETQGYVWLTSYSRIPVSTRIIILFFSIVLLFLICSSY